MADYVAPELQTDVEPGASTSSDGEELSNMAWTSDNSFLQCISDGDLPSTGGFFEPFDDDLSSSGSPYSLSTNAMFSSSSDDGLDDVVAQDFWAAQQFGNTIVESESGTSTCSSLSDDTRSTEVSALGPPRSHIVAINLGQLAAGQALGDIVPAEVTSGDGPPAALRQCTLVEHAKSEGHSLAKRTGWSREKAGGELAGNKQLVCPICAAPVTKPDDLRLQMKTRGKFAQYIPRAKVRQNNRLGKWYAKYGYCGPEYCRACAESFNSHLLKTAVRSKWVACTRGNPCARCTVILSHFEEPKEAVFRVSDGRRRKPRKKQKKQQGQEQNQSQKQGEQQIPPEPKLPPAPLHRPASESSESEKTSPLLNGMLTTQMGSVSNAGKRTRTSLAFATAVAVVACMVWLSSTTWSVGSGGTAQGPEQYIGDRGATEWICGAAAAASFNTTFSPSYLASKCESSPRLSTFACPLNDCADGQVPIGERTCRCDGCFRVGGRCGGWVLEGYGPSPQENGCEAIDPDPSPYVWTIPGDMSSHQCSVMCGDTNGCYRHDSTKNLDPKREGELQCDLVFPRPWPQPLVADWELPGLVGGRRYGYIWATTDGHGDAVRGEHARADAEVWYSTIDDGGQIGRNTNVEYSTSSGRHALDSEAVGADLHITWRWKFDGSGHVWQPLSSSLTVRPTPRFGAGRWVDSTGALFLVGGLYTGEAFGVRDGVLPFSSVDLIPNSVVGNLTGLVGPSEYDPSQLWRYDTSIAAWHPLHPTSATSWPRSRCGATVWRDRAGESSVLQTKVWMFGGWLTAYSNEHSRSGTELWRYVYEHERHNSAAPVPGQWTLVSAEVGCASQPGCQDVGEALYVCADQVEVDADGRTLRMPCPLARKDSGSWPSLNGSAGQS